ncbi:hypothetical protein EJ06DRAFT_543665 [Trichodelitschia bisporula]|uniref:DUF1279 domain-containing protein n=1 Tax=Trichodelitschia bisporula TaxID=703511 RepID=A0A6G1HSF1_9PEZI|nr:hypothetical protein EJ06DRAFT_543665 [Trichodelitschia bisporula]
MPLLSIPRRGIALFGVVTSSSSRAATRIAMSPPVHTAITQFAASSVGSGSEPSSFTSTETPQKPAEPTSLSARLKKLSREYGWSALGVYFALSALDFPFCFLAVRLLGTDRIGRWEESIVRSAKNMLGTVVPAWGVQRAEGWRSREVEEAQAENAGANASIWTQLALAYAIHKSFIFIRVPLTAAVTPKVVRVLRGWGWDIGKRRPKAG